jgi:hypothetical protein
LKDNNPVYRKQFKIPEANLMFIEQSLEEWLKLGIVKRAIFTNFLHSKEARPRSKSGSRLLRTK